MTKLVLTHNLTHAINVYIIYIKISYIKMIKFFSTKLDETYFKNRKIIYVYNYLVLVKNSSYNSK